MGFGEQGRRDTEEHISKNQAGSSKIMRQHDGLGHAPRQCPDMPHVKEVSAGISAQISYPLTPQETATEEMQCTF